MIKKERIDWTDTLLDEKNFNEAMGKMKGHRSDHADIILAYTNLMILAELVRIRTMLQGRDILASKAIAPKVVENEADTNSKIIQAINQKKQAKKSQAVVSADGFIEEGTDDEDEDSDTSDSDSNVDDSHLAENDENEEENAVVDEAEKSTKKTKLKRKKI